MLSKAHDIRVRVNQNAIDAIFDNYDRTHSPGVVIGIALHGEPVYRRAFGMASLDMPVALTPSTRLRIGSTSKHFTCFAYLLLCEQGLCSIDDPVGKFLPELHPVTHKVTMRQLMSCTSGLRDVYDVFYQFNETFGRGSVSQSVTSADLLSMYEYIDDVNAEPGTAWLYNNGGWLILSEVIQRITGQQLEDVLRQRVFEPIGMWDTFLRRRDDDFVPNCGSQHARHPSGYFERLYWGVDNLLGSGAIVSTVDDLLRWLRHMSAPHVGNAESWQAMRTPYRLVNSTKTGYALGLKIFPYRGLETVFHGGNALGGGAQMLKVPDLGLDLAIISNREDLSAMQLGNRVLDACLEGLLPDLTPANATIASGVFQSETTGRVIELLDRGGKQVVAIGGNLFLYSADGAGILRPDGSYKGFKQSVTLLGDRSSPSAVIYDDFGNRDQMNRIDASTHFDSRKIVGQYYSATVRTRAWVESASDGYKLRVSGPFGAVEYGLLPLAPGIWRTCPGRLPFLGGIVAFDPKVNRFMWSNFCTRALPFHRD